jgi:hypothetical protein
MPVSVKTRTIASWRPAAFAKRCISSKLKTRIGRGFFCALGSLALILTPLKGLRSQTSSVIASSVIAESDRTIPDGAGGGSTPLC